MLHCGVDWASDHHDVCIVDAEGAVRWRKRIGDRHALVREHTRLTNQLRSALLEYFPAALIAFDLDADSTLAFLERYPTPQAAGPRPQSQRVGPGPRQSAPRAALRSAPARSAIRRIRPRGEHPLGRVTAY